MLDVGKGPMLLLVEMRSMMGDGVGEHSRTKRWELGLPAREKAMTI